MAKVHLRDVRKNYADLEVIHGVDIEVANGEFIVIVGPSGCGKSTLLRMVAGLEAITGGEIVIGDNRGGHSLGSLRSRMLRLIRTACARHAWLASISRTLW